MFEEAYILNYFKCRLNHRRGEGKEVPTRSVSRNLSTINNQITGMNSRQLLFLRCKQNNQFERFAILVAWGKRVKFRVFYVVISKQ